jgi:NADPH-dependent 2,4-dienoyl-CoA reductase/sulfur reductase-like enzyme
MSETATRRVAVIAAGPIGLAAATCCGTTTPR